MSRADIGVQERRIVTSVFAGRPPVRPAEIDRTDLLELYGANRDRKVVLVCAPAGYGKSILAAQWCTVDPRRRSVWIALSQTDNDPAALEAHLVAGLAPLRKTEPVVVAVAAEPSATRALDLVVRADTPWLLVLDDLHHVTAAGSLDLISTVIDALPHGCQVLLATRTEPNLGLARRRANGDLVEIRADRLAMDIDTTVRFLAACGVDADPEAIVALHVKTEGWPAGIGLAALSHGGPGTDALDLAELSGEQRAIADYLFEEVLARQTDEVRSFLLHTSVVDRFCADLCDEMLGIDTSDPIVRSLEQTNLFVIPLDSRRGWYRYHHLFQDLLAGELDRTEPGARATALRRAAAWHESSGNVIEALRYAQEGGDVERSGRLVLAHWQDFGSRGQLETLRSWVSHSSDDQIASDASLAIGAGWVFTLLGDVTRAERYAAAASRLDLDLPSPDGSTSLRSSLANLRSGMGTGGVDQMLADGLLVQTSERPTRTRWLLGGCRAVGTAQLMLGNLDEAVLALEEAVLLTESEGAIASVRIFCLGYLALSVLDRGEVRRAESLAAEANRLILQEGVELTFQCAPAVVARASVRLHQSDLPGAIEDVEAAADLLDMISAAPWMLADLALRCAEAAFEVGRADSGGDLLVRAREALARLPDAGAMPQRLHQLERRSEHRDPLLDTLSPAEQRVLRHLPSHLTLSEIGETLFISRATVKTHVSSIYAKLGVASRHEAVAKLSPGD